MAAEHDLISSLNTITVNSRLMYRSNVGIILFRVVAVDWFLVSCIVTGELAEIGQKRKRRFISQTYV